MHHVAVVKRSQFSQEEDVLYLPRASSLCTLSLGHRELVADLIFVRAIIYFGGEMQGGRQYRWLEHYLDTIVALDPNWRAPYRWAGIATMYNGQPITNDRVRASSHFLELGAKQFPGDWELPFMLGCNYLFELKTQDPVERESWQRQGGEWIRHAALVGGGPSYVPLLAATIMTKTGRAEAAVHHLEEVLHSTRDEATRKEVEARLRSLHSKIDFELEARNRKQFESAWHRTVPYAPADFFVALGEPKPARLDWRWLTEDAEIAAHLTVP